MKPSKGDLVRIDPYYTLTSELRNPNVVRAAAAAGGWYKDDTSDQEPQSRMNTSLVSVLTIFLIIADVSSRFAKIHDYLEVNCIVSHLLRTPNSS